MWNELRQPSRIDKVYSMRIALLSALLSISHVTFAQAVEGSATQPAGSNEFASFGVAIKPPPAPWKRVSEGGTGHVVRWARYGSHGKPDAIMTLEMEPLKRRTIDQFVLEISKRLEGARVEPTNGLTIGGEKATRISGGKRGLTRTEAIAGQRGDYAYVVSAFADAPTELPRKEMEAVAHDLEFVGLAEPWAYTRLRGEKFPLFDRILLEPLATMRPNPTPAPKGQISVSAFNFRAAKPDIIMTVELLPNPSGATMAEFQKLFPGKLNPDQTATWAKIGDLPASSLSSTFDSKTPQETLKSRMGIVLLPPKNDVLMVFFNYPNDDPKAIEAYERASEAVVRSIEPIKK